ncbi:MAG: peptidoglycan binding domain-containing protein [Candidatus Moraniibacteriota bacterium]
MIRRGASNAAYTTEIEDPNFCAASYRFCDFFPPYDARYHFKSVLVPSVDESKLQSFLADLATKTDKEPQDAIFAGDANGKVIVATPDMPGQSLDIAASGDILRRRHSRKQRPEDRSRSRCR